MYARTTTIQGTAQTIADATAYMRDDVMPAVQQMDGFVGLSFLADRDSGRCIIATAWQTEEAGCWGSRDALQHPEGAGQPASVRGEDEVLQRHPWPGPPRRSQLPAARNWATTSAFKRPRGLTLMP